MCHVGFFNHYNGNAAVFLHGLGRNVEVYGRAVQYIAIRRGNFNSLVSFAIRKFFRGNKRTVGGSVKGVNGCRRRVGEAHGDELTVRIIKLNTGTGQRNGFACFCVFFGELDIAFKGCVVDKIAINLAVLIDNHIEVGNKLRALVAFCLMHGVNAVGQLFGFCKPVFISRQKIAFTVVCRAVGACGLQIDFKFRTDFGRLNLRAAVVVVLNNGDLTENDIFGHGHGNGIVLNGEIAGLCTDGIDCFVQ